MHSINIYILNFYFCNNNKYVYKFKTIVIKNIFKNLNYINFTKYKDKYI